MEFDYRQALRQQDMAIDLQMQERAKQWEIDKMQLRSQIDFQREEQVRQRKLDSIDSALQQIDKEVLAGRMTDKEAYPLKLKYEMNRLGVDAPTSLLPPGEEDEEERFGIQPYWMRGREAAEGTPERQLYESKLAEGISGQRTGTVPYYLDPTWLRETDRDVVEQVLASREIFFDTPGELDAFIERMEQRRGAGELPLGDKQLDVGVRSEEGEKTLDDATARQILAEVGGDRERARQLARQRGFSF